MDKITIEGITKSFPALEVLKPLSFTVQDKEFLTILGPSGCGKSTLLHIIAGLYPPDAGRCLIDGREATCRPGSVSYMPQKDLLLPWKTVYDNVTIPLKLLGKSKNHIRQKATQYLDEFGLRGFEDYYPGQLSGGMRQRAALLRAYLYRSDIMLLDEPLGALDAYTRLKMQKWLLGLIEKLKTTVLMVTHDVDEALLLSDRILILSERPAVIRDEIILKWPHRADTEFLWKPYAINLKKRIVKNLGA